jgi:muramoyltetrapeptide carboxypeptidase LdcA involved in peptidoglycan recycling
MKGMRKMIKIIPEKLKAGDEIRVIAPSRSLSIISEEAIKIAKERLESLGFIVTFSKNVMSVADEDYKCATIEERLSDLHEAFADRKVKAILTAIGGFNCNQLLDYIDYELIKNNPKIFCGYSDITALSNSIYTKTGLITYSGVHFSSFGMREGFEYSMDYFKKVFMQNDEIDIKASSEWSDDRWFKDQDNRNFIKNEGMFSINEGKAEGKIVGGNLCTLNLLQGTEYMPDLTDTILFIEDDDMAGETFLKEFDRNFQSLLHSAKGKIKGIVLGRAQIGTKMNREKWIKLIKTKKELEKIPVIADADFGHTTPIFAFPIGGYAIIESNNKAVNIKIKD